MKLLLIDGSSMIATLYYATLPNSVKYEKDENKKKEHYKDIMQANGKYTNAIFSMMKKILKIIEKQDVTHIAVAFDKSRNTFRKEIYSQYKANRKTTEEPLAQQFKNIMEYLNRMGIQVFASSMFEADDIIGSLCEKFKSEIQISVLTKDKDYLQLADKNVTIWLEQKNQIAADELFSEYNMFKGDYNVPEKVFPFNEELIYQYFNILPKQVADWKAITGDTSDNIPGVKGVASASTILLSLHDTVENIFEYVKQNKKEDVIKYWKENGIKRAPYNAFISEQNYETAKMSKILATIVKDLMFDINTIPEPENNTNNISKLNDCALKNVPNSLLVTSEVKDFETCGATSITQYKNLFVLEYETEEQAETAYETLCNDSNIYSVEWNPTIETNIETENTKYEVNEEKVDLKEYFSNTAESVVAVLDVEDEKIDENEHETKVINTIRENNESILIIPIKVVDENGLSTTLKIYAGIQKALENGANIIVLNITNKQIESSKILCNEITTLKNNGIQILMQTNEIANETVENPTEETLNKEITDDILNTNSNDTEKTGEETENVVSEAKNAEEIENTDISEIESQIKKTVAFTIDTVIDLNTSDAGDSATHDCQKYLVSKYDANYHWKQCSICGKVFQKTSHTMTGTWTLGNSCSANNVYRSACSCGYSLVTKNTRTHQHFRWNANQKIHVRWCDDCNEGVGASEPHRDANGNVLNCSNRGKCVVCGLTPSRHESTLFWSEYKNAFSSNASEQGYCSGCGKQGIKNYKVSNIVHNGSTVTFDISYSLASGYSFANIGGNNGVVYPSGAGTCSVVHSRSGNTMTDHVTAVLNYAGVFRISWNGVDLVDLSGTAFGLGMYADVKAESQSPVITGFNPKNLSTVNGWGTKTQITLTGTENFGNQVNITVKGEDGILYVNNVATNVSNNKWTYTFTPNIEASTTGKKLTVTVTDLSKNSTSWTYSVYSVDGIAPICKATDTTDTKWSKTKSYTATCTDEGAGKINISALNASNYEQATVSGNNFSKTYTFTGDIYGSKEIPIYYKDFAGNVSTSFLTVYNLDNTAPTITNATSTTGAGKADITIKANDVNTKLNKSGSGISSYGISDSNVETPTSWQQDNKITVFDNGTKYVYAKDVAGNISAPFKIEVTINSEVTFDANSGKCDVTQKTFSYGKTYGALPTPTRTGYTFEGWYTEDGAKITEDSDVIKKSAITFYAKWTPNIYTVIFNANGGDVNTSSKKVTFDEKYGTLPIPTRTNHKFVGWKNNGNTVTEDTIYKETGNTTLVAEWKLTHCIVNFDTNDGTTIKSQNKEIGSAYGNLSIPNKKGYDFIGWYTEKNGGGEKVQKTSVVPQKEEITLYAYYKLHPITVKIPKKLITDEKGNSTFKISADNQVGTISVKTSEKIIFTQKNKSQKVTGKIILDKNILNASQHEITGKISTNGLSAGTWKGTFNIDLSFVE